MLIRRSFASLILLGLQIGWTGEARSAVASGSELSESTLTKLLHSDSSSAISAALAKHRTLQSRHRACAEQRQHQIVPTFCFHSAISKENREILVRECRELARTAETIPNIDSTTPSECTTALLERAADLRYAGISTR